MNHTVPTAPGTGAIPFPRTGDTPPVRTELTTAQADGWACVVCGRDYRTDSAPSVPVGVSHVGQTFACADETGRQVCGVVDELTAPVDEHDQAAVVDQADETDGGAGAGTGHGRWEDTARAYGVPPGTLAGLSGLARSLVHTDDVDAVTSALVETWAAGRRRGYADRIDDERAAGVGAPRDARQRDRDTLAALLGELRARGVLPGTGSCSRAPRTRTGPGCPAGPGATRQRAGPAR